jgi:hypothetical protein
MAELEHDISSAPVTPTAAPSSPAPSPAPQDRDHTSETGRAPEAQKADRSPDQGVETRQSLLDAVQQAVPEMRDARSDRVEREPSGVPLAPGRQPDAAARPSEDDLPDEVTQEELSQYGPQSRRRINRLVDQRKSLRAEIDRVQKTLGPGADAADHVAQFMKSNDISREDFTQLLDRAAELRRGDFAAFYRGVKPYMDLAEQYLGLQLPQDLQRVVQSGQMSPQAAALFHRERMDRALSDTQRMRQSYAYDLRDSAASQQQLQHGVMNAVNAWEASVVAADPDYALKKAAVNDVMWSVVREHGTPQSPEQAVAVAQEAYRRVNAHYGQWAPPQRRATPRTPSSTGRFNGAAPQPTSLREAVSMAIGSYAH